MRKRKIIILFFFIISLSSCKIKKHDELSIIKTKDGVEIGLMLNNMKAKSWSYYDKSNNLLKTCNFKEGKLEGRSVKFNSDGNIILILNFKNNRINGDAYFYSSKGELLAIYEYNNDILKEVKLHTLNEESPPRNHTFKPVL